jgi:hypothetical protein
MLWGWEVDETVSELYPTVDFGTNGVEPSGFTAWEFVS